MHICRLQIAIEKMIKIVNDKGIRLLTTIDDITKSNAVVSFASAFQNLILKKLDVFSLMTGLYENMLIRLHGGKWYER